MIFENKNIFIFIFSNYNINIMLIYILKYIINEFMIIMFN
jgi:hypothetical protein